MGTNALDSFALIVLLLLAVILPLVGIWDFRRLMRWTAEGRPDARLKTYRWILAIEWILTLGLLAWWFAAGRSLETLGMVPAYHGWRWLALGVGLAGSLYLVYQMVAVTRDPRQLAELREKVGDLEVLVPRSPGENRMFALVSVTAGVCEEIVYRGILMAALTPALGLWPAVVLSSVIFGMGHAYQGLTGIVKTTLVGLGMALLTVFSGSLLAAIVLHSVIDLTSGRMMGAALDDRGSAPRVPAPAPQPSRG